MADEVIKFENGDEYVGEVANGMFNGKGKFTLGEGIVYEGNFVNGVLKGQAKITYPNGNVFEGDVCIGDPNVTDYKGKGKYTANNGTVFEGTFNNASLTGTCTIKFVKIGRAHV